MDTQTFNAFRSLVYEKAGIALNDNKQTLVSARLGKRMRALGICEHRDYLEYALAHEADGEFVHLLNAISTNFTHFFRESTHFEVLEHMVEKWISEGQKKLRVWCAASSTGEEPYTIAMTLLNATSQSNIDMKILATDISTHVLETASRGIYEKEKVKPVPPMLRDRFLDRVPGKEGAAYQVKPALRNMVTFKRLNLSVLPFPMRGPLDVVFCRNVMIYFDNAVRTRLIHAIHQLLKPGGYLFVGHAESLARIAHPFHAIKPSVYIKN